MAKDKINVMNLVTFDSSTLTGGYDLITTLFDPLRILRIVNDSDTIIFVSYNGVTDNDIVPNKETFQVILQSLATQSNFESSLARGAGVYLKGVAGIGKIYLTGYF